MGLLDYLIPTQPQAEIVQLPAAQPQPLPPVMEREPVYAPQPPVTWQTMLGNMGVPGFQPAQPAQLLAPAGQPQAAAMPVAPQVPAAPVPGAPVPAGPPAQPPAVEAPGQVVAPGQVAEPGQEPPGTWERIWNSLQDPQVLAPLQTFFSALAQPLSPGETAGSRLARSGQLMTLHRSMLAENARTAGMKQQKEELEMEKLRAETAEAKGRPKQLEQEAEIRMLQIKRLVEQGDSHRAGMELQQLQKAITLQERENLPEKMKLQMKLLEAQIETAKAQGAKARAKDDGETQIPGGKKQLQANLVTISKALMEQHKAAYKADPKEVPQSFEAWVELDAQRAKQWREVLKAATDAGIPLVDWRTQPGVKSGAPQTIQFGSIP